MKIKEESEVIKVFIVMNKNEKDCLRQELNRIVKYFESDIDAFENLNPKVVELRILLDEPIG